MNSERDEPSMPEPSFSETIPILRIFDVAKAKEFYVDYLGFALNWEHRFDETSPVYMEVERAGLKLHLSEHYGDCCPGSTVFVAMRGIDELHRELNDKKYNYLHPGIGLAPWNAKCMEVADPFGNRLRFSESLEKS